MKTALVTGAARGLGRAAAEALAKAGVRVLGLDQKFSDIPEFERLVYDLTDLAGIPALVQKIGNIDVLVNNAGIQPALSIDRYTDEARSRILRINLEAPVGAVIDVTDGCFLR